MVQPLGKVWQFLKRWHRELSSDQQFCLQVYTQAKQNLFHTKSLYATVHNSVMQNSQKVETAHMSACWRMQSSRTLDYVPQCRPQHDEARNIMLSKRSQRPCTAGCQLCGVPRTGRPTETESDQRLLSAGGWRGKRERLTNGCWGLFLGWQKCSKIVVMVGQLCAYTENHCIFAMGGLHGM